MRGILEVHITSPIKIGDACDEYSGVLTSSKKYIEKLLQCAVVVGRRLPKPDSYWSPRCYTNRQP